MSLLASERKSPPFWTFEYYQGFFDVDTIQVCKRIIGSMVPAYRKNYLVSQIRPNPDLYGPFWVCATLVFTTAIAGNLASYLVETGDHQWVYDFHKGTILWAIPIDWLRWIFVIIGMTLSGSVLLLTFWPAVEDDDKKVRTLE
ncbi:hypothetical protein QZH41_008687 [Actinostola sp. cb2023]|nr:hypothetical protein QZH41_008687 [Actinostola sp. cb2023]